MVTKRMARQWGIWFLVTIYHDGIGEATSGAENAHVLCLCSALCVHRTQITALSWLLLLSSADKSKLREAQPV